MGIALKSQGGSTAIGRKRREVGLLLHVNLCGHGDREHNSNAVAFYTPPDRDSRVLLSTRCPRTVQSRLISGCCRLLQLFYLFTTVFPI